MNNTVDPIAHQDSHPRHGHVHNDAHAHAHAFTARAQDHGKRLDTVLVIHVPDMTRVKAKDLLTQGQVCVNGRHSHPEHGHRWRKGDRVSAGDQITLLTAPPSSDFHALPAAFDLLIGYEDAHLVVFNKPAGMPSHPLRPTETNTAVNALVARYPAMAGVGYRKREPGILHRLDNDTSGLMLAARSQTVFEKLVQALKQGHIEKHYLALCAVPVDLGFIDAPLAHNPRDRRKMLVGLKQTANAKPNTARAARTEVLDCQPHGPYWCIKTRAFSAMRHQIRAHLAWAGAPLLGDTRYDGKQMEKAPLRRHALHASRMVFTHPETQETIDVQAQMPKDFTKMMG